MLQGLKEGYGMHIHGVDCAIVWFPHWPVHLTTFDGCSRAVPAGWVFFTTVLASMFFLAVTRVDISEVKFLKYFWWCWNKLKVHVQLVCFIHDALCAGWIAVM